MQGFKSFADKTKIEFDKGVTAVVGPNGSGKSNITESLRWALGESSAKSLRGGKMPDVIFAGTQSRSPLNYAQVAVVLDNSDAFIKEAKDEIRVERHIYRNGDSDYLIDGRKVRLRDVHDLFMDTGLGRDSFSIISQGRVEEIFNSKPEERRAIFEEAAGVLKYKTRKKETQSKLNQTQDNLDRLDDIIYELENQVGPLKKQAEVAKTFLSLDAHRKQLQLDILVTDIALDHQQQEETNRDLESLKNDLKDYYAKREAMEAEHQRLKRKRQDLSHESNRKQEQLLELTTLLSELEKQIQKLTFDSHQKEEKKEEANQRLQELQGQESKVQAQLKELEAKASQVSQELASVTLQIEDLSAQLAKFSNDPDQLIESLREDFVSLMQQEADYSNRLTALQAQLDKENQDRKSHAQEEHSLLEKVTLLEEEAKISQKALQESQAQVSTLLQDYKALDESIKGEEAVYEKKQEKYFAILDRKKAKEARQHSLKSIQKSHSQFFAGVRSVLQSADQLGGILGAVSEHLSFNKAYQTALEVALGASSQHIIVQDEAAAKGAIAFLKQNRQGRATFLPLTTIKGRFLASQQLSQLANYPGFLGTAESLVTYNSELTAIFQNLLGNTLIFDTIDQANQAAKALQYKVRIVTLDGTELRPGGSFSGGANRQNNSTFIKPELDMLKKELDQLDLDLKEAEKEVADCQRHLHAQKAEQAQLTLAGEEARLLEQKQVLAYQQIEERLKDSKALLVLMTDQDKGDQRENLLLEQKELENALQELVGQKEKLSLEIAHIKENKDLINQKKEILSKDLSQAWLRERELLSEGKFEKANQERLLETLEQIQDEMADLEGLVHYQINQERREQLPDLQKQLADAKSRKQAEQESLVQIRFEAEDYDAQLEELEVKMAKESQKNDSFIRQQTNLETQLEQLANRLRLHARSLSEDFQMSLDQAKDKSNALDNLEVARQNLQDLLKQIRLLGPINSEAIAQFEEVSQRLDFLNGQKTDLTKAKNMLLDTIGSMDSEVKARFKVTYEAIRDSFKETFKQMFGGGSADLMLTDGDLLSAGIEISVQPPGKKIQSLNLMSGGEKALSALALLFAIIRVKTIPFVILDEVEAALDEANVKRFGDYLNRFDKNSQFIVVTHRKGTMAAADSIYGITMQESGVSKVVSVKLKDSKELDYLS